MADRRVEDLPRAQKISFEGEEFAHGMPHDRRAYKVPMALTR